MSNMQVSGYVTIGMAGNGLSPVQLQAIGWSYDDILSNTNQEYIRNNFNRRPKHSYRKNNGKILSAKWHPSGLGLKVLMCVLLPNGLTTQ